MPKPFVIPPPPKGMTPKELARRLMQMPPAPRKGKQVSKGRDK